MKKNIFRYIYVFLALVILILCVILLTYSSGSVGETDPAIIYPTIETTEATSADTTESGTDASGSEETTASPEMTTEEPTTEAYVSPIDWESLWEKNTEIYAWLYIPGTEISYPVVQREGDDTYYLSHDAYMQEYSGGAVMSESQYNSTDFEDRVNILYGHKMRSGAVFGKIQDTYCDEESFMEHSEIIIYLPERELHYTAWLATSCEPYHLMVSYDGFGRDKDMRVFLRDIQSGRALDSIVNESINPDVDDKLLIISTCLKGNVSKRYLLISRLDAVE